MALKPFSHRATVSLGEVVPKPWKFLFREGVSTLAVPPGSVRIVVEVETDEGRPLLITGPRGAGSTSTLG